MHLTNLQSVDKLFYLGLCYIRERDHKIQHQKITLPAQLEEFYYYKSEKSTVLGLP